MNLDEFEFLMDKSEISLNDKGGMSFEAYANKDKRKLDDIIKENQMENLSVNVFQEMVQKYHPLYQVRKKLQQQKIEQFSNMTTQQVAGLPLEQKIEYIELLFPSQQTKDELMSVCQKNEENLKACLFNMDFPKDFWDNEKKSAERFVSLVVKQPEIIDKMKNWQDTSLDDKKQMLQQVGKVFEYAPDRDSKKRVSGGRKADMLPPGLFPPDPERPIDMMYQKGGINRFDVLLHMQG